MGMGVDGEMGEAAEEGEDMCPEMDIGVGESETAWPSTSVRK